MFTLERLEQLKDPSELMTVNEATGLTNLELTCLQLYSSRDHLKPYEQQLLSKFMEQAIGNISLNTKIKKFLLNPQVKLKDYDLDESALTEFAYFTFKSRDVDAQKMRILNKSISQYHMSIKNGSMSIMKLQF